MAASKISLPTRIYNVALGKPATQSSVSEWSSADTPEVDASVATNGDTEGPQFFHTGIEPEPWWQVDLRDAFIIEQLRIYNRPGFAERLRRFTVLASLTGATDSWVQIYRKVDDEVFGDVDNQPFLITPDVRCLARFVRIRNDLGAILHFRECEVLGYRPDSEELSLLHNNAEQIKRRLADEQAEIASKLTDGRTGFITHIGELSIFVDTENYSPTIVEALKNGSYEGAERHIATETLRGTDRVLEIGTAIGAVTMTVARVVSPVRVMTFDANPTIVADARRNFIANGLGEINAAVGVLRNRRRWADGDKEVDFFISREFWGSRLFAEPGSPDIKSIIKVPLVCLESKIAEHQANVLICDIEGGEADLLDGANLDPIEKILLEIHYWAAGRKKIDDMIKYLILHDFRVNFNYSANNIVYLDRY